MKLIQKKLESNGRSLYVYFPKGLPRVPFRRASITILRDETDEASVHAFLEQSGLAALAEQHQLILAFPNALQGGWQYPRDAADLLEMQDSMSSEKVLEPAEKWSGIPTLEMMNAAWHPMNDVRYLMGFGSGASMALAMAAWKPQTVAAVLALGGSLPEGINEPKTDSAVPVWLAGANGDTLTYFIRANETARVSENVWACRHNPLQCVMRRTEKALSAALTQEVWEKLFSVTRRTNTGRYGNVEPRSNLEKYQPEWNIEDTQLGDQNGWPHTWLTFVPKSVRENPNQKVPLVLFFHGGSDNPAEAAEQTRLHELGEQEGFITVYPWGSNRASWNIFMYDNEMDDVAFSVALIHYMIAHYPVDAQRVYLSGFSNGASEAQVVAMTHPELIAAICPIDGNWPGERDRPSAVCYSDIKPMALAMEKKKQYDYRMPMWYTYGTREPSYPVYKHCTQQHQYDFWKQYNNIEVRETPERCAPHPCGAGVLGDVTEVLWPAVRHAEHWYEVNRFYTQDAQPENYYNFVMMHDKGHEIAEMDPVLGWNYVRQFRRLPDGSLAKVVEEPAKAEK